MSKRNRRKSEAPISIIFRDRSGLDRHLEVHSQEAQVEVKALADRLLERAKTTVVKMADVLGGLQVPEEQRDECANLVNDQLNEIAKALNGGKAANYRRKPIPLELYRQFRDRLPGSFEGSYLEREIMVRHTIFDDAGGLYHLAKMITLIGESFGKSEDEIDQAEAKSLLLRISGEVLQAAYVHESEDGPQDGVGNDQRHEPALEPMPA